MKTIKKLASISAAIVLAASMMASTALTSYAAEATTVNIVVSESDIHTYVGYQIFTGEFETASGETSNVLVNAAFGAGVDSAKLLEALGLDADATASDAAKKMEGMEASAVAAALKTEGVLDTSFTLKTGDNPVVPGYYYVAEEYGEKDADILKVADADITITPKISDEASVEKKVWEEDVDTLTGSSDDVNNDAAWNDVVDAEYGETVTFKLTATMPSNLAAYKHFYFRLDDSLSSGLSISEDTLNVKYYLVSGETVTEITGIEANVVDDKKVSFVCDDALGITGIKAGDQVVVVYEAVLGEGYEITPTTGNDNAVTLTYSNNPESEYDGNGYDDDKDEEDENSDLTETPEDKVRVLTYELDINKVIAGTDTKLDGASFTLKNADGQYASVAADGTVTWVDVKTEFAVSGGSIALKGLDEGTYTLTETEAPDGYNKLTDSIKVVITSALVPDEITYTVDTNPLNSLTITYEEETATSTDGVVSATIENNKGSSLPSTGGIGTTLFYVGGGAVALGAGVLLITKKRMKKED